MSGLDHKRPSIPGMKFDMADREADSRKAREAHAVLAILRRLDVARCRRDIEDWSDSNFNRRELTLAGLSAVLSNLPLSPFIGNGGKSVVSGRVKFDPFKLFYDKDSFPYVKDWMEARDSDGGRGDVLLLLYHERVQDGYLAVSPARYVARNASAIVFHPTYSDERLAIQTLASVCGHLIRNFAWQPPV